MRGDALIMHGLLECMLEDFSFDGIKSFLENSPVEGIVFWNEDGPLCKIKRTDFGFPWPVNEVEE